MTEVNYSSQGSNHDYPGNGDSSRTGRATADSSWIMNRENGFQSTYEDHGDAPQSPASSYSLVGADYSKIAKTVNRETSWDQYHNPHDPVNRIVVEKVPAPEITQNVRYMFESGQIPDLHEVTKTLPDLEGAPGSGVFENEPIKLEGVVRAEDYVDDGNENLRGMTRSLLDQWKQKGNEEFVPERSPINIADAEGKVLENEPTRRTDVVREEDSDDILNALPTKGQARLLKEQWANYKDAFTKDDRPIKLIENENEPSVSENQPERRTDVLREEDNMEEIWLKKGFTRDLTGYWSTPKNDMLLARDKPIDLPTDAEEIVRENNPIRLEGVVRGDDYTDDTLTIEPGKARSLTSKWQNMKEEDRDKQPFRLELDVDAKEAGVYENQPVQLQDGVIRCSDQVEEVMTQRGIARSLAGKFIETEEGPRQRKEMIKIDLAEGPEVLENDPVQLGPEVIRSEYCAADENPVERGTTQNLLTRWRNQDLEGMSPKQSKVHDDPRWILEAERAQESGVFENEPIVRTDVIREEDYEPEMVPAKQTKNMREVWNRMGAEPAPKLNPQQVRFTPPRELTPPRFYQEEFKSVQRLTLSPSSDRNINGSSPSPTQYNNAYYPHSPDGAGAQQHPLSQGVSNGNSMTSSTMLVLK